MLLCRGTVTHYLSMSILTKRHGVRQVITQISWASAQSDQRNHCPYKGDHEILTYHWSHSNISDKAGHIAL